MESIKLQSSLKLAPSLGNLIIGQMKSLGFVVFTDWQIIRFWDYEMIMKNSLGADLVSASIKVLLTIQGKQS